MPTDRRTFLTGAAASSGLALRPLARASALGANDRIRIGAIGTGNRCRYLLSLLGTIPGNQLVAVCDAYEPNRAEARSRFANQAAEYTDYRKVIENPDIDAVVIGTPDHWHVPIAMAAVQAGKDVYVEKPLTHTLEEGAALAQAVAQTGRVVQVGMQQRSWPHIIEAKALLDSGALGQVTLVETHWYQNYLQRRNNTAEIDISKLDWDLFLGSARKQPFDPIRFRNWRYFWDFGGGALTDLFTHWVDVVHWFMGSNLPDTATATGGVYRLTTQECPDTLCASFAYPAKFQVLFHTSLISVLRGGGLLFRGTEGALKIDREGYAFYPEPATYSESVEFPLPARQVRITKADGTRDHIVNFLDCVRSRRLPNANVWLGIDAARPGQMGNIAYRENRTVQASSLQLPDLQGREVCYS